VALTVSSDAFKQFERLSFVARRSARAGLGGEHRSRRPSPSTEFEDYRPYQPGDDFRRVDWNVYGRLGSLQVKVTEGRERLEVVLVLDCSSSMDAGTPDKLSFSADLTAALAYVGLARADSVRILCLGESSRSPHLGPFGRRARMPELMSGLQHVAPVGAVDLNAALETCLGAGPRQTLVIVMSDLLTPGGVAGGLEALQMRQADVVVVHVVSPDELNPQLTGEVELIDAETSGLLELGVSLETLAAYRARFAAWLDERAAECRTRGIRYTRVRTDRALNMVVLDDLRHAGVLR
jgi:uncharacterized protein (DUF58 family)